MLESVVEELGDRIYRSVIAPLQRSSGFSGLVLGFDTEYDSKTGELISFQLSDGIKSEWDTSGKITVASLARLIEQVWNPEEGIEIILVSFFSIAELQFLPVKKSSFGWREYGAGSFDCSFFDERTCYAMHVFDLARFFDKQSLAKAAEAFGMKKLDWDRARITRRDLKKKGFREYALNDSVLVARIVQALRAQFSEWEVDPLEEKTAASTAASVFRRGWIHEEITCQNNSARLAGLRACWGGRAEALHRGSFRRLYEYDLSSAYPNAAIDFGVLPCEDTWREVTTLRQVEKSIGGVAHVRFEFPSKERYPCLPVILPNCQLYPLEGEEWVTFSEITYALELGAKVTIREAWGFTRGTTVLRDYMKEILTRRENAKGASKVAYKLLANALIGKLAQRVSDIDVELLREKAIEHDILIDDLARMNKEELRAIGLESQARVGSIFMPEWNALITGHVRARIARLVREWEAVYVATDAIWTPYKIPPKTLPRDLTLKRHGPGVVARTRLGAIFDDDKNPHVVHHSIWNRTAGREILEDIDGPPIKYRARRPIKLRESLRKSRRFGEWVVESRLAEAYWDDKRRLLPDGRTEPWKNADDYRTESKQSLKLRRAARRKREEEDVPQGSAKSSSRSSRGRKRNGRRSRG